METMALISTAIDVVSIVVSVLIGLAILSENFDLPYNVEVNPT